MASAIVTNAQLKMGLLGGLNSAKLFGDAPLGASYKSLNGFYGGLQIDFNVRQTVALSLQPSYSMEGAKLYYNVSGNPELVDSGKVSMKYLRIPLLAKIDFTQSHFYALAGFDVGVLLDASVLLNNEKENRISSDLNPIDVSFHSGVGYRWSVDYLTLFLEGRYVMGIADLTNGDASDFGYASRLKNSSFKLLFGIEWPLWSPQK